MRFVFMSDWFYNEEHIGAKIKSPIDFVVGLNRSVPMNFKDPVQLIAVQKILGQVLLDPPNVAGWKGGRSWIDSNTILLRLRLPSMLLNNAYISKKEKGEFNDAMSDMMSSRNNNKGYFKVESDWKSFNRIYQNVSIDNLKHHLILSDINPGTLNYLSGLGKASKKEYCIQLMSLPEYQMC